jgi:DNA-binding Lrp family transcriptional regulator
VLHGYIFIQAEPGTAGRVVEAVRAIDRISEVDGVTGPYDVIARVEAPDLDQLARRVLAGIQAIDGVIRTLVSPVVRH